jgi:hypothetical protein
MKLTCYSLSRARERPPTYGRFGRGQAVLGPLLGYLVLDLLRAREGVVLGKILAHIYLQAFPYFHDWAVRLFAWPRAFSDPT